MQKRAIAYRRVSGESQEDNTSLGEQTRHCVEYCEAKRYQIVAHEQDIVSGKFILARSGFYRALDLITDDKADVIVVDMPDRFGRGKAIGNLEFLVEQAGGEVEYVMVQPDPDTVEGVIMHAATEMVTGVERHTFRRRSISGKIARARHGKVLAGRMPKFGYQYHYTYDNTGKVSGCTLVFDEAKIGVYRMIVDWFLSGIPAESIPPLTLRKIAQRLTTIGVPTPGEKHEWSRHTINGILSSPVYSGRWEYNRRIFKTSDAKGKPKSRIVGRRSDADTIVVDVPAAITVERWNAIQAKLADNKRMKFVSPTTHDYLLRSLCFCSECKWRMVAKAREGRDPVYLCQSRNDHNQRKCSTGRINAQLLDDAAWFGIEQLCSDDSHIDHAQQKRSKRTDTGAEYDKAIKHQQAIIDSAKAELKRFTRRDIEGVGRTAKAVFDEIVAEIDHRIEGALGVIAELESKRAALLALAQQQQALADLRVEIRGQMGADMPFSARRGIVERLQMRCDWNHTERMLTVTCLLGVVDVPVS